MQTTNKQISLPRLLKITQDAFNAYIRERDKDKGCISCNSFEIAHASHFYSAGHNSALRFNESNVHGSCVRCNTFLHGNLSEYRIRLKKRIGEQKLLLLDLSAKGTRVRKWSRTELIAIMDYYKQEIKKL